MCVESRQLPESYVKNCLLHPRPGELYLFHVEQDGLTLAHLDAYAIIPLEEFERITGEKVPRYGDTVQSPIATRKI